MVVGRLDRGEVRVAIGDVELDREQRIAVLVDEVGQRAGIARRSSNFVAPFQCGDRPFPSEAA
jgi:hypothetical protein